MSYFSFQIYLILPVWLHFMGSLKLGHHTVELSLYNLNVHNTTKHSFACTQSGICTVKLCFNCLSINLDRKDRKNSFTVDSKNKAC